MVLFNVKLEPGRGPREYNYNEVSAHVYAAHVLRIFLITIIGR